MTSSSLWERCSRLFCGEEAKVPRLGLTETEGLDWREIEIIFTGGYLGLFSAGIVPTNNVSDIDIVRFRTLIDALRLGV